MKFGEGQPTNHGGRPRKAVSVTSLLHIKGDMVIGPESEQTRADRLAEQLWVLAESGDKQAIQYIIDRLDGKPKERVEHSESRVLRVKLDDGTGDDIGTTEAEAVHNDAG